MVKLKYRGPDTGQPAASVTCKPMKSLRQQPEVIRKGTWRNVSDSGRNLGQVAVYSEKNHTRLSQVEAAPPIVLLRVFVVLPAVVFIVQLIY